MERLIQDPCGCDLIFAFAFGAPWHTPQNIVIAREATRLAIKFNALVVTQDDVNIKDTRVRTSYVYRKQGHLSTLDIVERAVINLEQGEYSVELEREEGKPVKDLMVSVVAGLPHIGRCVRDIKKMGFTRIRKAEKPFREFPRSFWYSELSTERDTHSWGGWWKGEVVLRAMPFWIYGRITA